MRAILPCLLLAVACGEDVDPGEVGEAPRPGSPAPGLLDERPAMEVEKPGGLRVEVLEEGAGRAVRAGDRVTVQYVARLAEAEEPFGRSGGIPFTFALRKGGVIRGLSLGLEGLRVGTRCVLHIPSELGYGAEGLAGAGVPPDADLVYEVEILDTGRKR